VIEDARKKIVDPPEVEELAPHLWVVLLIRIHVWRDPVALLPACPMLHEKVYNPDCVMEICPFVVLRVKPVIPFCDKPFQLIAFSLPPPFAENSVP
jgi:hypothetical protein